MAETHYTGANIDSLTDMLGEYMELGATIYRALELGEYAEGIETNLAKEQLDAILAANAAINAAAKALEGVDVTLRNEELHHEMLANAKRRRFVEHKPSDVRSIMVGS